MSGSGKTKLIKSYKLIPYILKCNIFDETNKKNIFKKKNI